MEINIRHLVHGLKYKIEEKSPYKIDRIFISVFDTYEIDGNDEYLLWDETILEVTFNVEPFSKTCVRYDDMAMNIIHPYRKIFLI
jgi:hypothetical protein